MSTIPQLQHVPLKQVTQRELPSQVTQTNHSNQPIQAEPGNFEGVLQAIEELDNIQKHAQDMSIAVATGKQVDVHDASIAIAQADLSMRLMTRVRDQAISAYKEIMRINV